MKPDPHKHSTTLRQASSILLVERDSDIATPIIEQLTADGYPVALAHSAQHGRALAAMALPALVILGDLDSSAEDSPADALGLVSEIRNNDAPWREDLPVIVLGASPRASELLRAFDAGADDFLARPLAGGADGGVDLAYLELRARLRSLLRRATPSLQVPSRLCVGPLLIDTSSRLVLLHEEPVHLRPREYTLLVHLAREPTRVFSRGELLGSVWGAQLPCRTRTLDSHACRLRNKLAPHAREPWVHTVRGVGYRLIPE